MSLKELQSNLAELVSMAPAAISTDSAAAEAAQWVQISKVAETEAEELLGPPIKGAFDAHKKLTTQRKTLLEKMLATKERVRAQLASWIASGHPVQHCTVRTKYRVIVEDAGQVSTEFLTMVPDLEAIQKFVDATEGTQPVDGCRIEAVRTLYTEGI